VYWPEMATTHDLERSNRPSVNIAVVVGFGAVLYLSLRLASEARYKLSQEASYVCILRLCSYSLLVVVRLMNETLTRPAYGPNGYNQEG